MPLFHSLLVPLDGSEPSDAACRLALQIAKDQKASVTFVNVVESQKIIASIVPSQGIADPTIAVEQLRTAGSELLREALAKAQQVSVQATSEIFEGDPVETVVDLAKKGGIDVIVLGSHGRGGLERLVLGSVAEGVLRKSTLPVIVTKAAAAAD